MNSGAQVSAAVGGAAGARRSWYIVAAALFFLTLSLYSRVWPNEFVNYDDPEYVTANMHVKGGVSAEGLRWAFATGEVSYWHPLTWLSHMVDWQLFGDDPRGHHAVSVLWHGCNAALVFLVLRRLTGAFWLSALAAALFAWHPLRVESVAWVAERKDVLSGFFWLATLGTYAAYARRRDASQPGTRRYYAATLVLFAAALMSKPMAVTLPLALLVLDFWPLGRLSRSTLIARTLEKVPLLILSAVVSWVTIVAQRNIGTLTDVLPFHARIANAVVGVARYLGKIFAPHDLAVLYPHPGHWPAAVITLAAGLLVVLTGLAVWQMKRRPWLLAGWLWFLIVLLPASGVVQVGIQSMADRYTYLPAIGIGIAVLWTLREFVARGASRTLWTAAACTALAALGAQTWNQLAVWKNSLTLFHQAVSVAGEGNYMAYNNRGIYLSKNGRVDAAIADFRRSLEINPDCAEANNNLGETLVRLGQQDQAIPLYRHALRVRPSMPEAHNNLANALSNRGEVAEALEHYRIALQRRPDDVLFLNNYGATLASIGRIEEALEIFKRAERMDPRYPGLLSNLGNVYAILGRRDDAVAHHRRALEVEPDDPRAHFNLALVLTDMGRLAEAAESFRRSAEILPANPDTHAALGQVLLRLGRREEGVRALETALALQPKHSQAAAWRSLVSQAKSGP